LLDEEKLAGEGVAMLSAIELRANSLTKFSVSHIAKQEGRLAVFAVGFVASDSVELLVF
jgi:hypothetical protein